MTYRAEDERKLLIEFIKWLDEQQRVLGAPDEWNQLIDEFLRTRAIK